MAQSRMAVYRRSLVVALLFAGMLVSAGPGPALADVSAVQGSARDYLSNVSLFGGAHQQRGPDAVVTLPAAGGNQTGGDADGAAAQYGPAVLLRSSSSTVSTEGTTGPTGSVTSSAQLNGAANAADRPGPLLFDSVRSTCTADESGVRGSTAIANGTVETRYDPNSQEPLESVAVPANPPPGHTVQGTIDHVGDRFRIVFNEQVRNPDGSITVHGAHMYLLGPTAVGDLYIATVTCGVTAVGATTTTTAPAGATTTVPGATTTTAPESTTTTAQRTDTAAADTTTTDIGDAADTGGPTAVAAASGGGLTEAAASGPAPRLAAAQAPTTTTTAARGGAPASISGSAYGFFTSVGLFGGPAATRGPTPIVELPAGGSAEPKTASSPSETAQYGPATIFSSDRLEVSTQGTGGSVTSSATIQNVNRSGQEVFTAATLSSTCTADGTGVKGSTKVAGGKLIVSQGANLDSEADDVVVQIPADPPPNTRHTGKIENVGDNFEVIVNEHQTSAGGITVNAMHMKLLGPIAVGDLIIGQSKCSLSGGGGSGGGGGTGGAGGARAGAAGGSGGRTGSAGRAMPSTGAELARMTAVALNMIVAGWTVTLWAGRRRVTRHGAGGLS